MSASPSGGSNAPTPTGSAPDRPRFIRRPKPADPFHARKKPIQRPPPSQSTGAAKPNGLQPASAARPAAPRPVNGVNLHPSIPRPVISNEVPRSRGGWTTVPAGEYMDFPLVTTKKALRESLRYHAARFSSNKNVDPTDQNDFTRPVTLHRRDPRQPPPGKAVKEEEAGTAELDDKDQALQEAARLEKEAQKAADLAQIAPTSVNQLAKKKTSNWTKEKTSRYNQKLDKNEDDKKASDLRYEEALPWHLEDAENKHTWVGNYEAALSHTHVIFVREGERYRMIPLEKWYKFTQKNLFKALTIEEAEAMMAQKNKESRWAMKAEEKKKEQNPAMNQLYRVKGESETFKGAAKNERADVDDVDMDDNLFSDDEEHMTLDPDIKDEEEKEVENRIKKEQMGANFFGNVDEKEVDQQLAEEEKQREEERLKSKAVKKALKKREKNYLYDSDDSDNPYESSSSDDDSTDTEKKKEEGKKDEEAKTKGKADSKLAPGASSKGGNTPSGRPSKHPGKGVNHLKRPGSPGLSASEASGNESSRKKHKKNPKAATDSGSRNNTPLPSGQLAPGHGSRKSSTVKISANHSRQNDGSATPNRASDGEATGGEMSDGAGGKKKIKLRIGGSRAGSPAAPGAANNRAGSPAQPAPPAITAADVTAALPPAGLTISELMKVFQGRIKSDQPGKKQFIELVKANSIYDAATKKLKPKLT